ncbi:MAG: hypothetical protein ACKVVT_17330 [Dehalococcoidia bacterium]
MNVKLWLGGLLAAVVALTAVACGGGSTDPAPAPGAAPSTAQSAAAEAKPVIVFVHATH